VYADASHGTAHRALATWEAHSLGSESANQRRFSALLDYSPKRSYRSVIRCGDHNAEQHPGPTEQPDIKRGMDDG
jgi:hypothetical protein